MDASELVRAIRQDALDEDEDLSDYLVDRLADAAASIIAAMDEILKEMDDDERDLL